MRGLVIGYGSIGKRHAEVLTEMGVEVAVVSRRPVPFPRVYSACEEAVADWQPDYVVIASRTEAHYDDLTGLARTGYKGRVLVEKPLFAQPAAVSCFGFSHLNVAYNLRFHPVLQRLRKLLENQTVLALMAHVGQFLGDWRPGSRYQDSYSAGRAGGGVLRDLSHELDYVLWLTGDWKRVTAVGGKISQLQTESDDLVSVLLETESCPAVSIHMNYLQQIPQRKIIALTEQHTIEADFISGRLSVDGKTETLEFEPNTSYRQQHEALLGDDPGEACSARQGLQVVQLIAAIERSLAKKIWVEAAPLR